MTTSKTDKKSSKSNIADKETGSKQKVEQPVSETRESRATKRLGDLARTKNSSQLNRLLAMQKPKRTDKDKETDK